MILLSKKDYPAKILLFGEYSILLNSKAFAHPFFSLSGQSVYLKNSEKSSSKRLKGIYNYLKAIFEERAPFIDLKSFKEAIDKNWSFDSNIPMGHGLGSSGALSAAIYNDFQTKEHKNILDIRDHLSIIEGYFHRKSSGIDPLISLFHKAYLLNERSEVKEVDLSEECYFSLKSKGISVYLVDSGVSREAAPYISLFKEKCEEKDFKDLLISEYVPVVNECVDRFLDKTIEFENLEKLSWLQLTYFKEMFINGFRGAGEEILRKGHGALKLCGAGGGGYYLVFSTIGDIISSYFPGKRIMEVKYDEII